jgi:hypothetical protein
MRSWPVESAAACEVPGYFTGLFQQAIPPGNHLWTRARLRDLKAAGFGLREIVLLDLPPSFPPMGFQLGAVHLSRGWTQAITLTDWIVDGTKAETLKH